MDNIHSIARFAGRKVLVYWNLHKNMYSVMDAVTRRVITHTRNIRLNNVTFKVSEAGRRSVLHEKRKNVHAFVVGELCDTWIHPEDFTTREATYNPYLYSTFVFKDSLEPISLASCVWLENKKIRVA
jgi:hypothetical protein